VLCDVKKLRNYGNPPNQAAAPQVLLHLSASDISMRTAPNSAVI
jgi:hypothetical protein